MTLIGAMMIFMGLLGLVMAMRDEREEGWSQSRLKFSLGVISLLIVGLVLVIRGNLTLFIKSWCFCFYEQNKNRGARPKR
jgi:hypothetical protein